MTKLHASLYADDHPFRGEFPWQWRRSTAGMAASPLRPTARAGATISSRHIICVGQDGSTAFRFSTFVINRFWPPLVEGDDEAPVTI